MFEALLAAELDWLGVVEPPLAPVRLGDGDGAVAEAKK